MSPFEVAMLICFGLGWPCSILKTLRTQQVLGKSPLFLAIVALGYLSGVVHKLVFALDWAIVFYVLNLAMVLADLALYFRYAPRARACSADLGAPVASWPHGRSHA